MRLSVGIIVCFLLVCSALQAQRTQYGHIKGTVIDSTTRLPLEAATVSVFLVKDSALVNYALTNRKGEFVINNIPLEKACWLMISYSSYVTLEKKFTLLPDKKELLFDFITLKKSVSELEEVTVVARRPPVMVRADTVEFNVSSFKTMSNGVLEDVLKQLPGFELDREGNITYNGKKVSRLTLDGKDFFGGDPKIAIKNLPKEIIDKIQVADNKTQEQKFNKRSTGNEDLAINLTLRKEIQRGWFGRLSGGYGSSDRYETMANLNYLKGSRQLNFIGNANNTSRDGSSGGDFNISNGRSTLGGGSSGFTDTKSSGLNYSDNISSKLRMNGSYYYNQSKNTNSIKSRRQNILPDTTFFYNSNTDNTSSSNNHQLALNVDYNIDTLTEFHLNSSFGLNRMNNRVENNALSEGLSGNKINSSRNIFTSLSDGNNLNASLFFGRRFKKAGRGFTMGLNYGSSDQQTVDDNIGENIFYKTDSANIIDPVNQRATGNNGGKNISFSATYSEPLFKNTILLLQYVYQKNSNTSERITNRFNSVTGKYDQIDSAYSNSFKNTVEASIPAISIGYNKEKIHLNVNAGMQFLMQYNYNTNIGNRLQQRYVNFTPSATIGYNISKTSNVNFNYNGGSQQPSLDQLQPLPDNSNPLYIRLGNPDLVQSFYHNFNLNMRLTNGTAFWYGSVNFNATSNQVIYETFYDEFARQVSKPVNVNGNYRASGNYNYSKTWKRTNSSFRLNLSGNGSINRNKTFTNKVINISNGYSISQAVGMSYTYKQLISVLPSFAVRLNKTKYSIQSLRDAEFITKTFGLGVFWNYPKRLIIENSFQYSYNDQVAPGFRKGFTMWSAAADWQLLKDRRATLRFAVYDILKQNIGVYRSVTETYIEDRQSDVLQRYFMLSFIYNLRTFGK